MELYIYKVEDLENAAKILLKHAGNRKKWCFYGEVGAGKTTFIKAICQYLKVKEWVTSPTYSLVNEYTFPSPNKPQEEYVYHLDLYRLNQIEEALDIGIEEYLYDDNYCFIEWPEIIDPILPDNVVKISMEIVDHSVRKILCL